MKWNKAIAGGLTTAVTGLTLYVMRFVSVVADLPPQEAGYLELIIGSIVGAVLVYLAPANTPE